MAKEKPEEIIMANPGELGDKLQQYREKAGYSSAQMADALCLSEEVVRKLENEDFDNLPEPPYIRGYLRNYAKLAEADSEGIINTYESLRGADPRELDYHFKGSAVSMTKSKKQISPIFGQLFFLALLVTMLGAISMIPGVNNWIKETWASFSDQTATQEIDVPDKPVLTGSMPVPIPLPIEKTVEEAKSNSEEVSGNKPQESDSANNEVSNDNTQAPTSTDDKTEQTEVAQEAEATDDSVSNTIKLKFVFNKEVWMRIRDKNKKTLFEATNTAGNEKELELEKPLTFRVGNAQGLSLFVGGKPVDISSYIKGSVANFTLE